MVSCFLLIFFPLEMSNISYSGDMETKEKQLNEVSFHERYPF